VVDFNKKAFQSEMVSIKWSDRLPEPALESLQGDKLLALTARGQMQDVFAMGEAVCRAPLSPPPE
jgi:hypothetical protein